MGKTFAKAKKGSSTQRARKPGNMA